MVRQGEAGSECAHQIDLVTSRILQPFEINPPDMGMLSLIFASISRAPNAGNLSSIIFASFQAHTSPYKLSVDLSFQLQEPLALV